MYLKFTLVLKVKSLNLNKTEANLQLLRELLPLVVLERRHVEVDEFGRKLGKLRGNSRLFGPRVDQKTRSARVFVQNIKI